MKINLNPKLDKKARAYISKIIAREVRAGRPQISAIAQAYRMARAKGYHVPKADRKPRKNYGESQAYRGYLISKGLDGYWRITRDGHHIGGGKTLEAAKREIDSLYADNPGILEGLAATAMTMGTIANLGARRNPMDENEVMLKMLAKGYRYKVTFRERPDLPPLYVKTMQDISRLMREDYPEYHFDVEEISSENPEIRPRLPYGGGQVRPRAQWSAPSPVAHLGSHSPFKGRINRRITSPHSSLRGLRVNPGLGGRGEADEIGATELQLFIENDADLYRQQYLPIIKNLMRKRKKGIFDAQKAVKLFMYLVDNGAKKYNKEYGGEFNVATRRIVAQNLTDHFIVESDLGNYDNVNPAYKIQGNDKKTGRYLGMLEVHAKTKEEAKDIARHQLSNRLVPSDDVYLTVYEKTKKNPSHSHRRGYSTAAKSFIKSYMARHTPKRRSISMSQRGKLLAKATKLARSKGLIATAGKSKAHTVSHAGRRSSIRPSARSGSALVKIYDHVEPKTKLYVRGSANAGTNGITKSTGFIHRIVSGPSIYGVRKSGPVYLSKGNLVMKGSKPLFGIFPHKITKAKRSK